MTDPEDHTPAPDASRAPTELALAKEAKTLAEREPDKTLAEGARPEGASSRRLPDSAIEVRKVTLTTPDAEDQSVPAPATPEAYVGFIIDGRYHVELLLAQGGMGVVYRARHRIIDKPVALKVLRPELVHNREITQRFLTEAQAASAIGSEHIVDITDYGELPDGATYIVMEYLDGQSLAELIDRPEPIAASLLLTIARQLCEGLQKAHDAHIIHRDLKPDNVLLVRRGGNESFVKILDFGIAKVASSQNQITRAGRIFGTPHYMSPEQAAGTPQDHRTDIYSLGVIFYQMLSCQLPFDGENPLGILTQHMYAAPPPLGDVCPRPISAGLEAVITKCLSKKPDERYGSMQELDEDLERLQQHLAPNALHELQRRDSLPQSLKRRLRKATPRSWQRPTLLFFATASIGVATISLPIDFSQLTLNRASTTTTAPATGSTDLPDYHEVALVLAPHDAHVYSNGKDLGMMPINIRLRPGQIQALEVRRAGYRTKAISVDGSESRIVVQLAALPGAESPPLLRKDAGGRPRTISFDGDGGAPRVVPPQLAGKAGPRSRKPPGPPVADDEEEESVELTLPAPPPLGSSPPEADDEDPLSELDDTDEADTEPGQPDAVEPDTVETETTESTDEEPTAPEDKDTSGNGEPSPPSPEPEEPEGDDIDAPAPSSSSTGSAPVIPSDAPEAPGPPPEE